MSYIRFGIRARFLTTKRLPTTERFAITERGPNVDFEVAFVFDETKVLEYQGGQVGNRYVFAHGL